MSQNLLRDLFAGGTFLDPFAYAWRLEEEEEEEEEEEGGVADAEHHLPITSSIPIPIPIPPPMAIIQRDLGRLNLSSSSSSSSYSPSLLLPQFPFPWAADGYATKILSVDEITWKLGITEIRGEVECIKCHHQTSTIGFDLKTKSMEVARYISFYKDCLDDNWLPADHLLRPLLNPCPNCCCYLKPVIPFDYKKINWLFLFLGDMLGCCSVEHLNFFCKHSTSAYHHHRTGGAKDRLLYLTYLTLCKHLYPTAPFDP